MLEQCRTKKGKGFIHPIIDWGTDDVWEYIKRYNVPYCSLYDEGRQRLGCIGCPFGSIGQRRADFERWPKYKNLYIKAIERMHEERRRRGLKVIFDSAEADFNHWISGEGLRGLDENQTTLFGIFGDESML